MTNKPVKFAENLVAKVREILWQQWRALGIAGDGPETGEALDLEALILATAALSIHDNHLANAAQAWLAAFGQWVNRARLKRMHAAFAKSGEILKKPLIAEAVWWGFDQAIPVSAAGEKREAKGKGGGSYPGGVDLRLNKDPLLQLRLRAVFGVNARAEVLIFLFLHGRGNSNQIARAACFDQKIVYRILERWAGACLVAKESEKRDNTYTLLAGSAFFLSGAAVVTFWSWQTFFAYFSLLTAACHAFPWAGDTFLLASLFRELHPRFANLATAAGTVLPDPGYFPRDEFFAPMAGGLLALLDRFI